MKYIKSILQFSCLLVLCLFLSSCGEKEDKVADKELDAAGAAAEVKETVEKESMSSPELPKRYQRPAYMIGDEIQTGPEVDEEEDVVFKVGATIRSTTGPQPLWDIMKRLAAMKNMNISWESDVDQNLLIDVDINANDDFYKAIDNLLRQVDYYHEMQDNTIVVKYKETRQYHIGMPFTKQVFETATGGNVLGSNDASANIAGLIRLDSKGNEFNLWQNIEDNLKAILNVWTTEAVTDVEDPVVPLEEDIAEGGEQKQETTVVRSSRRVSGNQNLYTIDKPIGLITVHAPRPLLNKLDVYFANLKTHLYKQISIEAKIIEVALTDASSIGINWSSVLKNFNMSGMIEFGSQALGGQVWPYIYSGNESGTVTYPNGDYQNAYDPTRFVSKVTMDNKGFDVFLNALNEEGESKVLSNPKISVMNGQPALITVGRNVTYIDSIESDLDSDTGVITYTVNTERILSGVGMALTATIINDDEVVMNLVPVTSELDEPIEYKDVGSDGGTVGLPIVNIREMSTTVRVNSGEMLVIGGLISDDKEEAGEFLPVLGKIPLVKYLFGYEEKVHTKRELIILLKPVVL